MQRAYRNKLFLTYFSRLKILWIQMARSLYCGRRHHRTGEGRSEAGGLGERGSGLWSSLEFVLSFYRGESTVLSFVSWLTLSGTEQSSVRGPSTENQEAKRVALDCIKVTTCLPPGE